MTIDPNTLLLVSLSGFALFCGLGFVRALLRERRSEMTNRINEVEENLWRENEKVYTRLNSLERFCREQDCCKAEKYPTKNHYNTGA
jgi:hypothetical protein